MSCYKIFIIYIFEEKLHGLIAGSCVMLVCLYSSGDDPRISSDLKVNHQIDNNN